MTNTPTTVKKRIAQLLDDEHQSIANRWLDRFIIASIVITALSIILESVPSLHPKFTPIFFAIEIYSLCVFGIEYGLRIWSSPENQRLQHLTPTQARLTYIRSPMAIIDLLAIVPFILSLFAVDLRFLRVVRLLRIFKLTRYSSAMDTLFKVIKNESRAFCSIVFVLIIILIVASSCIYLVEHKAQPETFGSIPDAMWWTMVTLATVGYGDAVPVTALGKILGGIIMVVGIGLVALPAGILASAFSAKLHQNQEGYQLAVKQALEDGIISPTEHIHLQSLQQHYNITPEDAEIILKQQFARLGRLSNTSHHCPHCGKIIDPTLKD